METTLSPNGTPEETAVDAVAPVQAYVAEPPPESSPVPAPDDAPDPLRSVYTSNLPEILGQLGVSLAVSTYQAGKVILVRNDDGVVNTHFRNFHKPMGIAADASRLTIGGANTVWYYRNMPAVASKIEPNGKHDACYLPREIHVTGDIDIHEMAYDSQGKLWVVNTKFCTLCHLDPEHSFDPVWRPHFVTALAAEDRCHLNGLAVVNGKPKYVTALEELEPFSSGANQVDPETVQPRIIYPRVKVTSSKPRKKMLRKKKKNGYYQA